MRATRRRIATIESAALAVGCCAALVGCSSEVLPPAGSPAPKSAAEVTSSGRPLTQSARAVLDVRERPLSRLAGQLEPVVIGTDAHRVVRLDEVPAGFEGLEGERVLDARFSARGVVVLGADHVLRLYEAGTPAPREIDREALGPLSVEGGRVAYVRGESPDLAVRVASLDEGGEGPREVAPAYRPAWSPALSEDGAELVFVATHVGRPRLFRVDAGGGEVRLERKGGPLPSSSRAPVWRDGALSFTNERGEWTIEVSRAATIAPGEGAGLPTVGGDIQ